MDFKNYNSVEQFRKDSKVTSHDCGICSDNTVNDGTSKYNNKSGEGRRKQQTKGSRTYRKNSKTIINNTQFTSNAEGFYENQDDFTKQNFNTDISKSDQFTNGPCSSKPEGIQNQFKNHDIFEVFKSTGVKAFCSDENEYRKLTEKSTYCRALYDNQTLVYRTLAKNARLQRLVKKLVLLRHKQKDEDLWNNYINELKNRHGHPRGSTSRYLDDSEELPPVIIEDYSDTHLDPYHNLLKDLYTMHNNFKNNLHLRTNACLLQPRQEYYRPYVFENQSVCYPTSSQGRLMMLSKARQEHSILKDYLQHRNHLSNTIFVDRERNKIKRNETLRTLQPTKSTNTVHSQSQSVRGSLYTRSIQTDLRSLSPINEDRKDDSKAEPAKEKYKLVAKNVEKLKRKLEKSNTDVQQNALDNIENKLNNLIQTLNTFMVDIRCNNPFNRDNDSNSMTGRDRYSHNELNAAKSDTLDIIKREEAVCRVTHGNLSAASGFLTSASARRTKSKYMKIDKILKEEMDKSNKVKRDIEDLMYQRTRHPRAVQITLDIPTRERSTEVTDSLSKAKLSNNDAVEEIGNPLTNSDRRMTIAVNTDPLGLLGLLRVSSEAVKQILSYMPHIDYYSYLSMLQFPQSHHGPSHYICNICGASFQRPSQLSDHIQTHNLGYSRDCCVCRHVLDMKRHRPGLFKCKHCGQRFTRAYCCELHEESCARRFGVSHDVNPGLNLLQ